jgi:hypothetical protein
MGKFMTKDRSKFGLIVDPKKQTGPDTHRPIGFHARIERRDFENIDPNSITAVISNGAAEHATDIVVEGLVANHERRIA